jgi:hypothetical protein
VAVVMVNNWFKCPCQNNSFGCFQFQYNMFQMEMVCWICFNEDCLHWYWEKKVKNYICICIRGLLFTYFYSILDFGSSFKLQFMTVHPKTLCFRFWRETKNISHQNWLSLDTNFDETMDRNT